jgi:hypothetical protein
MAVCVLERPFRDKGDRSLSIGRELVSEPQAVRPRADEVVVAVEQIGDPAHVQSIVMAAVAEIGAPENAGLESHAVNGIPGARIVELPRFLVIGQGDDDLLGTGTGTGTCAASRWSD